jgi:hypothetical protein
VLKVNFEPPSEVAVQMDPPDGIAWLNGTATLTARAKGTPPFGYEWQFPANSAYGRGPVLQLDHLSLAQAGPYTALASNFFGSAQSGPIKLSVVNVAIWGTTNGTADLRFIVPPSATDAVTIATSPWHTLALHPDGSALAWGNAGDGQLAVPSGLSNFVAVAAGETFSLGLRKDGTVVAWGDSGSSNFGLRQVPAGLSNVIQLAASYSWALALKSDGTVSQWGSYAVDGMLPPMWFRSRLVTATLWACCGTAPSLDGAALTWIRPLG